MRGEILGSGRMGGKLGRLWARAGHEVVFSYARSQRKLGGFVCAFNTVPSEVLFDVFEKRRPSCS
jgi:hypothetical protein